MGFAAREMLTPEGEAETRRMWTKQLSVAQNVECFVK